MKRLLALSLAIFICISLCACGNTLSEEEISEKYTSAVELFNQNKYEEALSVFNEIATYSDSAHYIYSCVLVIEAKENFEGTLRWQDKSSVSGSLSDNEVYMHAWNSYDTYIIDFASQTITLDFNSPTTSFQKTRHFDIISSTLLRCIEFRGDEALYIYFNYDANGITVSRSSADYFPMIISR